MPAVWMEYTFSMSALALFAWNFDPVMENNGDIWQASSNINVGDFDWLLLKYFILPVKIPLQKSLPHLLYFFTQQFESWKVGM